MNNWTRNELKKKVMEIVNTPPPQEMEEAYADLPDVFDEAMDRAKNRKPGITIPGHKYLSEACHGIRENGFTIICGPSGKGKTTFLANLWIAFHAMGLPTFAAPVENGRADFMDMLVSIVAGKSRNSLSPGEWEDVRKKYYSTFFSDRRHTFSKAESRLSHLDMLTDIYHSHITKGTKIALCDNWQFMQDFSDDRNAMARSDKALHECVVFTKHVPLHLFMVMHPNKDGMARVENEGMIKGSSTSVQEAHNIWLFNPLAEKDDPPPMHHFDMCREIKVAKSRYNGRATGTKIVYTLDPVSEAYSEYKAV